MLYRRLFRLGALWLLVAGVLVGVRPAAADKVAPDACLSFAQTGYSACGSFLTYWEAHGGLAQFGYPISPVFAEQNAPPPAGDGRSHNVQYFQRARFEAHPENNSPYNVLLGLIGAEQFGRKYPNGTPASTAASGDCQTFVETGYAACGAFLAYWQTQGVLPQFGYPISPAFDERNAPPPAGDGQSHRVQYFQRARFEAHPENGPQNAVLLGLLGAEQATAHYPQGYPPPIPPPTAPALTDALPLPTIDMSGAAAGRIPTEQASALNPDNQAEIARLATTAPVYTISVQPDFAAARFRGHEMLDYVNTTGTALINIVFRLYPNAYSATGGSLTITAVAVDGVRTSGAVAPMGDRNSYAAIPLPAPLPPGATTRIELAFSGTIPQRFDRGNYGQLYLNGATLNLAQFYPQVDVWETGGWAMETISYTTDLTYAESAFYTVAVVAPPDEHLFGTGISRNDTLPGVGAATRFVSGPVREFAAFMGPNYATAQTMAGALPLTVVYDPATTYTDALNRSLRLARAAMTAYSANYGPYPYAAMTVLYAPTKAGGLEWPTIVQLDSRLLGAQTSGIYPNGVPNVLADYGDDNTFTLAHELAHQWWYSVVGDDQQKTTWIDEGLTNYSAYLLPALSVQATDPAAAQHWEGWLTGYMQRTVRRELDAVGDVVVNQPATGFDRADSSTTVVDLAAYQKPPLFYDTFRRTYGDAAFLRFTQNLFRDYHDRIAYPGAMLAELQAAAPGNAAAVAALFQRWLQETHADADVP